MNIRAVARVARIVSVTAMISLVAGSASAEELCCPPAADELSPTEYLRALSLDLRGVIPTVDELERVAGAGEVSVELIDEMLVSEAFTARAVRRHQALLWNNVSNVNLLQNNVGLANYTRAEQTILWRPNLATLYRGDRVPCLDEPARFTGDRIETTEVDGSHLEGWVEVRPYWSPDTTVRVCAFDAQEAEYSPIGTPCASLTGLLEAGCGCGPNLVYCRSGASHNIVNTSLNEDVDRRVADVIGNDLSYLELFRSSTIFINGPIAHFLRFRSSLPANVRVIPLAIRDDQIPSLDFTDTDTWIRVDAGSHHAGVLTSPAYLLRFQTNRSRANRFHNAFLCDPFEAPPGALSSGTEVRLEPDLQVRDGCSYCHSELEPSAAYWGRWGEQGAGFLDPEGFPPTRDDCRQCALEGRFCGNECSLHYLMRALSTEEIPYLGMLRAYVFRRDEDVPNIDDGPAALAMRSAATGALDHCVSSSTAEWLLGRELDEDELEWGDALADEFAGSGYSYRALVRAIVTSDTYRRVR